jgi:hypothetical protein
MFSEVDSVPPPAGGGFNLDFHAIRNYGEDAPIPQASWSAQICHPSAGEAPHLTDEKGTMASIAKLRLQ